MEHDDEIEGRLLSRRQALHLVRGTALVLATGGKGRPANAALFAPPVPLIATPAATQGPFFVDENLHRSDLTIGSDRPAIAQAVPFKLDLTVYTIGLDGSRMPLPQAQVDLWHVDALGVYSDEPQGLNPENTQGERWLRGFQRTDAHGRVGFQTVFPGWYRGRTTHIHFKIRYLRDGKQPASFTSQFFLPDTLADQIYQRSPYRSRPEREMRNQRDMVYRGTLRDGTRVGELLTLRPQPLASGAGYAAQYTIAFLTHPHPSNGGHKRSLG